MYINYLNISISLILLIMKLEVFYNNESILNVNIMLFKIWHKINIMLANLRLKLRK